VRAVWVPVMPLLPKAEAKVRWTEWLRDHELGEGDFRDSEITWNTRVHPNLNIPDKRQYLVRRKALLRHNLPAERNAYVPPDETGRRPYDADGG